ncbi:MAG: ferrous iron transport protein A [Saprospiraceae bacterium]|nr:ferrous iron transport protein A [Saprospiraceae bacterium]
MAELKSLISLLPEEEGVIIKLSDHKYASKLMTLGVLQGVRVKIIRFAPFGGALYLQLPNHQIALRNDEAASIIIEKLDET